MNSPNELDEAKVIFYTKNYGSEKYGIVSYEDEGRDEDITGLAICKYTNDDRIYLFACNQTWDVIGDTVHDSIDIAKEFAEDYYEISNIEWHKKDNQALDLK